MQNEQDPRIGKTAIHQINGDQYAGIITGVDPKDSNVIYIGWPEGATTRCKRNRPSKHGSKGGYGEQDFDEKTGKWKYSDTAKYRHFSTWYEIEGTADTVLSPHF